MNANNFASHEELVSKDKDKDKMIYNPIVGLYKDDEGVDQKAWIKKQHLSSQGLCSTFKFFCKQSCKDVRRHKCQFCLGFCSVFVVVLFTLIINTLIDKGPVIFLKLAEDSTGEIDAVIKTSPIIYSSNSYGKYINYTQIRTLYGDEYNFSGRKLLSAQYVVPTSHPSSDSLSSTGLPTFSTSDISSFKFNENITFNIKSIDTNREKQIKCGTKYSFDKLKSGECLVPSDIAQLSKIKTGDFVYMKFDINEELYSLYDHYKVRANDKTGYIPKMGTVVAPCKVKDIYSSSGGKQATSDDGIVTFMEIEYYYKWLSPYVQPDDTNPSMVAFRQFLLGDYARSNDYSDYVIMTFPDPRTSYYSDSSYDNIQNNVVGYTNKIVSLLGFFPISVTCDILQELQTLSMSLVLIGIVFTAKGLSIESKKGIMGMGFEGFWDSRGLRITFWVPSYPKIGGGRIYSKFSHPRGPFSPLPTVYTRTRTRDLWRQVCDGFTREILSCSIFTIIAALFIIISILLIYSLLMVTVEEKSFEIGIYRMVGLNKCGLITMVLLKAFFFVIPAIICSFFISILCLWVVYRMFLDSSMGTSEAPVPSPKAVLNKCLLLK